MYSNKNIPNPPIGPYRNAILKLEWAKCKIEELSAIADHAFDNAEISLCRGPDLNRPETHDVVSIRCSEDPPEIIALMTGEVLQSARSALDYLAVAVVKESGGVINRYVGFPFGADSKNFSSMIPKKLPGVRKEICDAFRLLKPFPSGNYFLYALHDFNKKDKHIEIINCLTSLAGFAGHFSVSEEFAMTRELAGDLRHGIGIFSMPRNANFEPRLKMIGAVCVNYESKNIPVGEFVRNCCNAVQAALASILRALDRDDDVEFLTGER